MSGRTVRVPSAQSFFYIKIAEANLTAMSVVNEQYGTVGMCFAVIIHRVSCHKAALTCRQQMMAAQN